MADPANAQMFGGGDGGIYIPYIVFIYIYVYIYMCVCVCVCIYICLAKREKYVHLCV
jgi:hypothetical protein